MKIWNFEKLVANLHDKKNMWCTVNHGLVLKKVHSVIKLNEKAWLKSYFDINAELKKSKKMALKNIFSSSWIMQF